MRHSIVVNTSITLKWKQIIWKCWRDGEKCNGFKVKWKTRRYPLYYIYIYINFNEWKHFACLLFQAHAIICYIVYIAVWLAILKIDDKFVVISHRVNELVRMRFAFTVNRLHWVGSVATFWFRWTVNHQGIRSIWLALVGGRTMCNWMINIPLRWHTQSNPVWLQAFFSVALQLKMWKRKANEWVLVFWLKSPEEQ